MAAGHPDYDALFTTTLRNRSATLIDNVFKARPLFFWLTQSDNIKTKGGGTHIVEPLMYAESTAAGSYAGTDTLSTAFQEGLTSVEFPWKQFYATVAISGIEEAKNSSEEQLIDLLDARILQAEETIKSKLNTMFYGAGTGNSGKDWDGLGKLIGAGGTVGGIDATDSDNAWWRSHVKGGGGVDADEDVELSIADMTNTYNSIKKGADGPNGIVTTQDLYEAYEAMLLPQARYTDMKTADAGFENLVFKTVPVTYDEDCPAKTMYFLNTRYLKVVGHSKNWFRNTPFVRPNNQDAMYAQILVYGNLIITNRARQGVMTYRVPPTA